MEGLPELIESIGSDIIASGICKGVAPAIRFCKPYAATAKAKTRALWSAFWSDFKRALDNPFGLLWLLSGCSMLAIAGWASIDPATAPTALWSPLAIVLAGFLTYFTLCGAKTLAVRLRRCRS